MALRNIFGLERNTNSMLLQNFCVGIKINIRNTHRHDSLDTRFAGTR